MSKLLPTNFPQPPAIANATYNYVDVADGTGVTIFYGAAVNSGSYGITPSYILTPKVIYSAFRETTGATTPDTIDFDLTPFNSPRYALGTAEVTYCAYAGASTHMTSAFEIYKWDGTSAVSISPCISGATITGSSGATDNTHARINHVSLPLTPTQFVKGDVLRLRFTKKTITGTATTLIGIDPKNRDGNFIKPSTNPISGSLVLQLDMPFRLDL